MKQNCAAFSTTEAEYITVGICCAQILWMRQTLQDYGVQFDTTSILYDNTSPINIFKNFILHARTKHIDVDIIFLKIMLNVEISY